MIFLVCHSKEKEGRLKQHLLRELVHELSIPRDTPALLFIKIDPGTSKANKEPILPQAKQPSPRQLAKLVKGKVTIRILWFIGQRKLHQKQPKSPTQSQLIYARTTKQLMCPKTSHHQLNKRTKNLRIQPVATSLPLNRLTLLPSSLTPAFYPVMKTHK